MNYQILDCQNKLVIAQGNKWCKKKSSVLIPADFTKNGTCPLEKELWMSLLNSLEVVPREPYAQDSN